MGTKLEGHCYQFISSQLLKTQNVYYSCVAVLGEFPRVFLARGKTFLCYSLTIYYVSRTEYLLPTDFEGWIFLS